MWPAEETQEDTIISPETIESDLRSLRKALNKLWDEVKVMTNTLDLHYNKPSNSSEDICEMIANTWYAYRHIEDAAMRLWKVLQAKNGGVSIYDL